MRKRLYNLDMVRGLAALMVVIGHVRAVVVEGHQAGGSGDLVVDAFYVLTGFGYQAVLMFFALSGYLVGGQALRAIQSGGLDYVRYFTARLSRLWTVLLPGLVLTFLWDQAGILTMDGAGYDGRWVAVIESGFGIDRDLLTFLGNAFFLQLIAVNVYGSNAPLWSLSFEFWYYVLGPIGFSLAMGQFAGLRTAALLAVFAGLLWLLPVRISVLGLIWVGGALLQAAEFRIATMPSGVRRVCACAVILLFATLLLLDRMQPSIPLDVAFGLSCCGVVAVAAALPSPGDYYRRVAVALSEISYTLYLAHLPPVMFFAYILGEGHRLAPSLFAGLIVLLGSAACVAYAAALWWCFERHTPAVRRWISALIRQSLPARRGSCR